MLNSNYTVTFIAEMILDIPLASFSDSHSHWIKTQTLPHDAKNNPDKYLLPLDVVNRGIHYAIYLGNEWVAHLPGEKEPTQFDTWSTFCEPSSSSFFLSSSSSLGTEKIISYHPRIPYKKKDIIIRHIAKVISHRYGRWNCHPYNPATNNCEHLVKGCVFGINGSQQSESILVVLHAFRVASNPIAISSLKERIETENRRLDNLTSYYSYERGRIEQYIREAENNRSYTRSKYQIEQEKFEERITVYPKDWCRIS